MGTLAHLYSTDLIWTARLKGERPPALLAPSALPTRPELWPLWSVQLNERRAFAAALRPGQQLHYTNLQGEAMVSRVDEALRHMINHASYHRGQVVTLLRQLGHAAPNTDLIRFYRERSTLER